MKMDDELKVVVNELFKKYPKISVHKNGRIFLGSGTFLSRKEFTDEVRDLAKEYKLVTLLVDLSETDLIYKVCEKISSINDAKIRNATLAMDSVIEHLIPIMNPLRSSDVALLDKRSNTLSPLEVDAVFKMSSNKLRYEPAILEFNPYGEGSYVKEVGNDSFTVYNLYNKPAWRVYDDLYTPQYPHGLPTIVEEFFHHLIPDNDCREYLYDWIHHAITSKNNTFLVLNGAKGIGKNIFSDDIMRMLVDESYHLIAPESGLESNFNSWLKNKRIIVMDEKKVDTPSQLNKLKRYINPTQSIERKGIDVSETIDTYNSFIICNNSETDMRIEHDDRRFSVMDLTRVMLKDIWNKKKIESLIRMSIEDIAQMGYFFLYRKPKYDQDTPYKGRHFYHLCYVSVPEWGRVIIDMALKGDSKVLSQFDVRKEYRLRTQSTTMPRKQKIQDFLNNYLHLGEMPIGNLVDLDGAEDKWEIIVNENLLKDEVLSDVESFDIL